MDEMRLATLAAEPRTIGAANPGDSDLGPLKQLPGVWAGKGNGFNMIALPTGADPNFRLLLNQYDEDLTFTLVDKPVPNRGETDQLIVALDYEQVIHQVAAADHPESGNAGPAGKAIHHEAGMFLYLLNEVTDGLNIVRLATIPHGDTALMPGFSREGDDVYPPTGVSAFNFRGLPLGVNADEDDLDHFYLEPYKVFHDKHFMGFDPVRPDDLLSPSLPFGEHKTTVLDFDSSHAGGAVHNIPFVVRQNNPVSIASTFWIHEYGDDRLFLQYEQVVMMEFFGRRDGLPGKIQWPHVSINTLERLPDTP